MKRFREWLPYLTDVMIVSTTVLLMVLACAGLAMWPFMMVPVEAQSSPAGEPWTCSVDNIGATLTLCQPFKDGYRLYLTDVMIVSTTTTAGTYFLRTGTGTNCATGTASFLPSAATAARFGYVANNVGTSLLTLQTPIATPKDVDLCIQCVATNTCTAQLSGYAAP